MDKYKILDNLSAMVLNSVRAITHQQEILWCNLNVEMVRQIDQLRTMLQEEDAARNGESTGFEQTEPGVWTRKEPEA